MSMTSWWMRSVRRWAWVSAAVRRASQGDTRAPGGGGGGAAGGAAEHARGGGATIPSGGNFAPLVNMLTSLGVKKEVAEGAIAFAAWNESNLDPTARNPSSGAYGIFQWLDTRKDALTAKYGKSPTFEQQMEFAKSELMGDQAGTLEALKRAQTQHEGYTSGAAS